MQFLNGFISKVGLLLFVALFLGASFFFLKPREVTFEQKNSTSTTEGTGGMQNEVATEILVPTSTPSKISLDIEPQSRISNPPTVVRAVYLTSWSGGSSKRIQDIIDLAKKTGINGVVVDIKDYSGYVAYDTDVPEVEESGAEKDIRIVRPNAMIKQFHDNGIYVIGRVSVFQDSILAAARPEWALHDKLATSALWKDRKGIAWMDAGSKDVWDYNIAIARDAFARGFDEINFDYIRFPSDGVLSRIKYAFWDEKSPRHEVMRKFFEYVSDSLPEGKISADLFGLVTVDRTDLGIGQIIEDAFGSFDYISPMIYPSHYGSGFIGYANPALYPYEVIQYSLTHALARLKAFRVLENTVVSTSTVTNTMPERKKPSRNTLLRPWLQVFDMGAVYDISMIKAQIRATDEVLGGVTSSTLRASGPNYAGWLLWDPSNNYKHFRSFQLEQ